MKNRILYCFLFLLLLADLVYSFRQHLSMPMDGDMAGLILPSDAIKPVLNDPLGISVITKDTVYLNPNRFFAHWAFYMYFNSIPEVVQSIVEPIESPYLASAIVKIIIQLLLICLFAAYITGNQKTTKQDVILASVLIIPLFQTNGYRGSMGIIDPSITYTFFYALPCTVLLLFYLPFFRTSVHQAAFPKSKLAIVFLIGLALFTTLSGPLTSGIVLVISLLLFIKYFVETYTSNPNLGLFKNTVKAIRFIPKPHLYFFTFLSLLSLYSLYLGSKNVMEMGESVSILERYSRIPVGLFKLIAKRIGFPVLFLVIAINCFLIRKYVKNTAARTSLTTFAWIGLFSVVYVLLLPFGGYREYRQYIVRYDTIMPVTLGLMYIYGASSYLLIKHFEGNSKKLFLLLIIAASCVFTIADEPEFHKNECEKLALKKIATSEEKIVLLESDCTVMEWEKITDPNKSTLNTQLLVKWRIMKDHKLYYQK